MDLRIAIVLTILSGLTLVLLFFLLYRKETINFEVRDVMLGPEELERHAAEIGRSHITGKSIRRPDFLVKRMKDNFSYISRIYESLNDDVRAAFPTVPASEWLLDNFYVIEEQVDDIVNGLSQNGYSGLPALKGGQLDRFPRVYAVALEIVAHTDGAVDEKTLVRFLKAYQTQSLLSMGELWTVIIMVRIALIENLRTICEKVLDAQTQRHKADELSGLITTVKQDHDRLIELLGSKLDKVPHSSFVEFLMQRLKRNGVNLPSVIQYIDSRLAEKNYTTEKIIELEHQLQAGLQVSMGNSISSLRTVAALDWAEIFEELSHAEAILRQDPGKIYSDMDFDSRNLYRNSMEKLAQKYGASEIQVARKALECAEESLESHSGEPPRHHVGYYIIGKGIGLLENKLGYSPGLFSNISRWLSLRTAGWYIGLIISVTLATSLGLSFYAYKQYGDFQLLASALVGLLVLIPVSDVVISIINSVVSHMIKPTIFPKLELKEGIPEDGKAMVIIPTLLPNDKRARELVEQMEIIYLSNQDRNLFFALVGDFKDTPGKSDERDRKIVETAMDAIRMLNRRYASPEGDRFFYFHRHRQFNERQKKWMGWERKRGAITEFNDFMRGSTHTGFSITSTDTSKLPHIKYVITLDADTNLPPGTAKRLVGTVLHPLNRAVIDEKTGIVKEGYGLLQPRINVSISSANSTLFSRIFAGQGGIDPYTTAVSDVYQDLFGEGIFTGKGIYDLDVYRKVLNHTIPDNTVLSHDLLEGSYIRAGLATDIELVDGYPARYNSYAMRLHRWVRGDWQLLPWLGRRVRDKSGRKVANPLSAISRWKILDNMRRSLLNPMLLILILSAFSVLPGNRLVWIGLAAICAALPLLSYLLNFLLSANYTIQKDKRHSTIISGFRASIYQTLLQFAFIPYQAYLMVDAVLKTLIRVLITRRNLLEWVTAADMESSLKNDLPSFWKRMWVSPITGLIVIVLCALYMPLWLSLAVLTAAFWVAAPFIAYRISKPYVKPIHQLSENDRMKLRRLARKTWAYYEDFAGEDDNYLPPDNYQEEPVRVIAHRTSPTNIGFLLMSIISARDMGYIGTIEMLDRINKTVNTMEKMEKWKGHLYNWYDTRTLRVLKPFYISTVDSGNLIGYLMVAEQSLREYTDKLLPDFSIVSGLKDTIYLLNEELAEKGIAVDDAALADTIEKGKLNTNGLVLLIDSILSQIHGHAGCGQIYSSFWGHKLLSMLEAFKKEFELAKSKSENIKNQCRELVQRIHSLTKDMEFKPLFDKRRQLFAIGYNVDEGSLSKSYYDLLASESRQASYIAVARGEVDQRHWFRLGRKLVRVEGFKGLVSWTGTMFEYLMPLLLMRNFENTLLDETYYFVLRNQKRYGTKRGIPWGISESGYYAFDVSLNYQYKAFGVPELGLKRGLGNDIVIAPYAVVLALMVDPAEAVENMKKLESEGVAGRYGYYEAVDYTPARLQNNKKSSVVRSFMAHHQGMSMVALDNYFNGNIMQKRFHRDPVIKSAELLLQERVPARVTFTKEYNENPMPQRKVKTEGGEVVRVLEHPNSAHPDVHILSNGAYSVMVTGGGSGYSKKYDMAVSRWSKDLRSSNNGVFIFIQNMNSNNIWSAAFEPFNTTPEKYKVVFSPDKAEFIRRDGNIETHSEIVVSPEDNAEVRRVSLTNYSEHTREIEATSYFEVVLTQPEADLAHPAFSNLFIRTEFLKEYNCLIASRRPRSEKQGTVWALHTVTVEGEAVGDVQYETDRAKFMGRNRDLSHPQALDVNQPLSNTTGAVLDPVMSLRRRVRIQPGETARISYIIAAAETRKQVLELADKYQDYRAANRAFELAWTRSQVEAEYLGINEKDQKLYMDMTPYILFSGSIRRNWAEMILNNKIGQPGLWPFGVSGDIPIMLVNIGSIDHVDLVYQMLKAHEFWRVKGLSIDLVFLVENENDYTQPLMDAIRDAVSKSHAWDLSNKRSGVFILNAHQMTMEERTLFYTVARIVFKGDEGPAREQFDNMKIKEELPGLFEALTVPGKAYYDNKVDRRTERNLETLQFFNGLGGFTHDGKEYVICLEEGQHTPAPWINVVSNPRFGFLFSESGSGHTWSENSRENKLTPWSNDPVTDPPGEVFYLRDEEENCFWSITPMPIRERQAYIIRHGFGYSAIEHTSHGIAQELIEYLPVDEPVKVCIIKLKNLSCAHRRLSLIYYMRPVLGVNEQATVQYIATRLHEETGAVFVTNSFNTDFSGRVAFIDTSEAKHSYTGDRAEFLGENGSIREPEALKRKTLSGRLGAGFDPCVAIQVIIELKPDDQKELVVLLGQGRDEEEAKQTAVKYRNIDFARKELERVKATWEKRLGTIKISTPDASMNIMMNGWLLYQVISCRIFARSAFYQSGGALGFRDQLQDVMALEYSWPELTRNQIILHASRQFVEGDVQHWWHAEAGKGIRTRYSDDLIWLAYVTADYIECTGDWSILDEQAGYLESEPLREGEDERYEVPRISEVRTSIYEHCIRVLDRGLRFGERGIPLMGCGDWNDGMNTVGNKGKGESVWLGWFIYTVLQRFIPICIARSDTESAERFKKAGDKLAENIEKNAWDGNWYRRAYFDDGTPLGSVKNSECKIDSISQSWAVISGAGKALRTDAAMSAVERYLVDSENGLVKLLTPPFDEGEPDPGYIKGYVPGVRENGGQYTHAASWVIYALAKLGNGDRAWELFHLINPVNHGRTPIEYSKYKLEPYVIAADVYAVPPHTGRGGWSWYTGAAGWMYRIGIEHILGFKKRGNDLYIDPCIPKNWENYEITYRYGDTVYNMNIRNKNRVNRGIKSITVDGAASGDGKIKLVDDGIEHEVVVELG